MIDTQLFRFVKINLTFIVVKENSPVVANVCKHKWNSTITIEHKESCCYYSTTLTIGTCKKPSSLLILCLQVLVAHAYLMIFKQDYYFIYFCVCVYLTF